MESGNGGSMKSSSGRDEEQDVWRSDQPYAPLLSSKRGNFAAQFSASFAHHQQRRRQPLLPPSTFYDALPGYLVRSSPAAAESGGEHVKLDVSCPTATRSCTDMAGSLWRNAPSQPPNPLLPPSSSGPQTSNPTFKRIGATTQAVSPSDQAATTAAPTTPRGSKKRPRASRRAPTTVLTTDTSNFRQMVQEFTGIPTPPFPSPAFPRARFGLFNSGAAASSMPSSPAIGGLLRPFAQKMSIPSPTQTLNLSLALLSTSSSTSSSSSSSTATGVVAPTATSKPNTCSINNPMALTSTTTASGSAPAVGANPIPTGNYQLPATEHPGSLTNQSHGLPHTRLLASPSLFRPTHQPPNPSHQSFPFPCVFGWRPPVPTTTSSPLAANVGGGDYRRTTATHTTPTTLVGGGGGSSSISGDGSHGCLGDGFGSNIGGRYASIIDGYRSDNVSSSSVGEGALDSWICSSPD